MAHKQGENQALWAAFRAGERKAFSQLFFGHYQSLYQYGRKVTDNEDLLKDVIQDVFLYLFENRERLAEEVTSVPAYLLAVFRRRLLSEITRERAMQKRLDRNLPIDHLRFELGRENIIITEEYEAENKDIVLKLLSELSPRQREIIYLKYYLDLSLSEIAEILSISYQAVANQLYRSIKKLRKSNRLKQITGRSMTWFLLACFVLLP